MLARRETIKRLLDATTDKVKRLEVFDDITYAVRISEDDGLDEARRPKYIHEWWYVTFTGVVSQMRAEVEFGIWGNWEVIIPGVDTTQSDNLFFGKNHVDTFARIVTTMLLIRYLSMRLGKQPDTPPILYHKKEGTTKCIFYPSNGGLANNGLAIAINFPKRATRPRLELLTGSTGKVISAVSISNSRLERIISALTFAVAV
jgi:hypothetical protein